jgi:hypothetical protein
MWPLNELSRQQSETEAVHGPGPAYVCVTWPEPLTTSLTTSTAVTVICPERKVPSPVLTPGTENVSPIDAEHGAEKKKVQRQDPVTWNSTVFPDVWCHVS